MLSTTIRRELGWIKKTEGAASAPQDVAVSEDEDSPFVKLRRKNWARLIAKVWLEHPALCPSCGEEMKVIAALTSPHQDAVIEKILRYRGEWASGLTLRARLRHQPSPTTAARPLSRATHSRRARPRWRPLRGSRHLRPFRLPTRSPSPRRLRAFAARQLASHPPWKRERRARGPPRGVGFVGNDVDLTAPRDEAFDSFDFNQDPTSDKPES